MAQLRRSQRPVHFAGFAALRSVLNSRRRLQLEALEPRDVPSAGADLHEGHDHTYDEFGREYCGLSVLPDRPPPSGGIGPRVPPYPLGNTFLLHSRPTANHVIYLDFDGHTTTGTAWNNASRPSIVTPAYDFNNNTSSFSDAELESIQRIWQHVVEDFSPFDVDVTTEFPGLERLRKFGTGDTQWGIRVIIGGNGSWFGSAGGVAYINSFNWDTDTGCFVFEDNLANGNEKYTAEAASHEIGHTLGLGHDGRTSPSEGYYAGHGSGDTGWAPIMGVGYYQNATQWSQGEYANANNTQDDLAIITSNNGFGYRPDDHGNTRGTATPATVTGASLNSAGLFETRSDVDYIKFTTGAGTVSLSVNGFTRAPNLDVLAELYNSAGVLIASANPASLLTASLSVNVPAGEYFFKVDGIGKGDATTGYTDYGSIGQYWVSGTIVPPEQNDSPVLDNTGNMVLDQIAEDATGNPGTLIADLIASAGGDRITDDDAAAVEGIAVFGAQTANGSWQFSTNNGSSWTPLGAITDTSARLLGSDTQTRIRFLPNANYNGTFNQALIFRAWDQTSGVNGGLANPGTGGGSSAFSVAIETAAMTVTPVNDAPVLDNTGDMVLGPVLEDAIANTGTRIADLIASAGGNRITDPDGGPVEGIALIATETANGSWEYSINGGTNWTPVGDVSTSAARLLGNDSLTRIRFVPALHFNGTILTALTFRAWDQSSGVNGGIADAGTGGGTTAFSTATDTAAITITPVNDAPTFIRGSDQDVLEDSGPQSIAGWATGILPGPADESGQSLGFLVSTDNDALFATLPSLSPSGDLTYTPATNGFGSATVSVRLRDGGGTANGGQDTSAVQTFVIQVRPVNDAPTFTRGADVDVLEDAGPQTITGWATDIAAGPPNESAQSVDFTVVSNTNPGLFATAPAIADDGTLTFTPAAEATGTAVIQIIAQDSGGTADGGQDTSAVRSFTISLIAVNDPPIAVADEASVVTGKSVVIPVLANDSDPEGDPLSIAAFNSGSLGTVRREGNTLVYTARLTTGGPDTFTYTLSDGNGGTATGTVRVVVRDLVLPTVRAVRTTYGEGASTDLRTISRSILPWTGIRRIAVVFNEDVTVPEANLIVTGSTGPVNSDFAYNPVTRTATWTLDEPLGVGRWTIRLSRSGIADMGGNALAADWARTFGLLPGDFNGDGVVSRTDVTAIRNRLGTTNIFADVDGSGLVDLVDLNLAKANRGKRLS